MPLILYSHHRVDLTATLLPPNGYLYLFCPCQTSPFFLLHPLALHFFTVHDHPDAAMSSISRNCASPLRAARLLADGPYTRGLKAWCAAFPDPIEDEYLSCGTSTFLGRANSRSDTTTSISTNGRNNQRIEFDLDLILRDESEKSTESIPVRSPVQRFLSQLPDRVRQPLPVAKRPAFRSSGKLSNFIYSLPVLERWSRSHHHSILPQECHDLSMQQDSRSTDIRRCSCRVHGVRLRASKTSSSHTSLPEAAF